MCRTLASFLTLAAAWLNASSQDLPTNPLAVRFAKDWKLERVQTRDGMQMQPTAVEFRLSVASDGKLTQGLYPEGMFESTWGLNVLAMTATMNDVQSNQTYTLHVLQLDDERLVLEAIDNGERTLMYYKSLP